MMGTISFVVNNTTSTDLKVQVRGIFPSLENMMGDYELVPAKSSKDLAITFRRTELSMRLGYQLLCEVQVKIIFGLTLQWQTVRFRGSSPRPNAYVLNLTPVNPYIPVVATTIQVDQDQAEAIQMARNMYVKCELSNLDLENKLIDATSTTTLSEVGGGAVWGRRVP